MEPLIEALRRAEAYPHPVGTIRLVETHISWVFLTGDYAYKVKKPASLGFLDFSTLEARQHFCEEEVRINRRFAPDLYLGVVPISASPAGPRIGGEGVAIEYAVRMRQFGAGALLAEQLGSAPLPLEVWRALGADVAALHARLPRSPVDDAGRHGVPSLLRDEVARNFRQVRPYLVDPEEIGALNALEEQAWAAWRRLESLMWHRYESGLVRECHGDLHLGNLVLLEGRAVPFDAIEFNAGLRWIDLMNELGFLVMDCEARGQGAGGYIALNAWLEAAGDYDGLPLLEFCCAYRAMVRAKISLLGGAPPVEPQSSAHRDYLRYAAMAARFGAPRSRFLALMCGVSGSGKSTLAEALAGEHRAIRIRSDVERKRLYGLAADADSHRAGALDIYSAEAGERTFARLETLAATVLDGGLPVILDATFIRRGLRERFRALAARLGVPFHIVHCDVPVAELRRRVGARMATGGDASEADLAVLESQLAHCEPPHPDREPGTIILQEGGEPALERLRVVLGGAAAGP